MINDMLRIEQRLIAAGINLNDDGHPKMKINSKGNQKKDNFLLIALNANGKIVSIADNKEYHLQNKHYQIDKNNTALTSPIPIVSLPINTSVIKKITTFLQHTQNLLKMLEDNSNELSSLRHLSNCIEKVNPTEFLQAIIDQYSKVLEQKSFISLEIEDNFNPQIQSKKLQETICEKLHKLNLTQEQDQDDTELDAFGGKNISKDTFYYKGGVYNLNVFNSNVNNKCFERFGIKGHNLCTIGTETRRRVKCIMDLVFDNKYPDIIASTSFYFKSGVSGGKGGKAVELIVIASALPDPCLIENNDFTLEEWLEQSSKILDKLKFQKDNKTASGEFLVYRKPTNGPWSTEYRKELSSKNFEQCLKNWIKGTRAFSNISTLFKIPTLLSITKVLAATFSKVKSEYRCNNTFLWTLRDSFDLFAGSKNVKKKAIKIMAKFLVPVFIDCVKIPSDPKILNDLKIPWQIYNFLAVAGLLLLKDDEMQDILKTQFGCIGRLFYEADRIHRAYFETRPGMSAPPSLIGQTYIRMAYDNPKVALGMFNKNFQIYLSWAQNYIQGKEGPFKFSVRDFEKLQAMVGAFDTEFSRRPDPEQQILLGCGFCSRHQILKEQGIATQDLMNLNPE